MAPQVSVKMDFIPASSQSNISIDDSEMTEDEGIFASTLGLVLHMLWVAIPKDIARLIRMKAKSIRGQTVVITGGASGIGQRMAEVLSLEHGAKVAIIDVNKAKADETSRGIEEKGGTAKAWKCDIKDPKAMQICADEIKLQFGTSLFKFPNFKITKLQELWTL